MGEMIFVLAWFLFAVVIALALFGALFYAARQPGGWWVRAMRWLRALLAGLGAVLLANGVLESVHLMIRQMQPSYTMVGWGAGLLVFALCMPVKRSEAESEK